MGMITEKPIMRQAAKVGVSGSLINQMMSNNATLPEIGKGATQLLYTDRRCYEVIEVSPDYKTVKLEYLEATADPNKPNQMGDQNWILKPTGQYMTVVWRYGAWYIKSKVIDYTKQFKQNNLPETKIANIYEYYDENANLKLIEGITEEKYVYSKISLIFGRKDYYYDWSF
jgi:hypothetical protein